MSSWAARIGVAVACLALSSGLLLDATSAAAAGIQVTQADLDWTRIAITGDPAPGGEPSDAFDRFEDVQVLADGTTYFVGRIDGTRSLFRWTPQGGIVRVYPDAIGATIGGSDPPLVQRPITDERDLQYAAGADGSLLLGVGADTESCVQPGFALLASAGEGPLSLVAQSGEFIPQIGATWRLASRLAGARTGDQPASWTDDALVFHASAIEDPCLGDPLAARGRAIFAKERDGTLRVVAAEKAPANGVSGAVFGANLAVSARGTGQVLVTAEVELGPSGPLARALYRWSVRGGPDLIVREGQPAPSGGVFRSIDWEFMSADGSVMFLDEQAISPGGVYRVDPQNSVHEITRIGGDATGAIEDAVFRSFSEPVAFAANGAGAIGAAIETPTGALLEGLWTVSPGGSLANRLLDSEGAQRPWMGPYSPVAVNLDGRVLYTSALGFSVTDVPGAAELVAGWVDTWEFDTGHPTPGFVDTLTHDSSLLRLALIAADSEQRTALFMTQLPEPGGAGIIAIGCLLMLRMWRPRT